MKRYLVKFVDNAVAVVYADDATQAKESAEIMRANDPTKSKKVKAVSARLLRGCGK